MGKEVYRREYPTTCTTITLKEYLAPLLGLPDDALVLRSDDEFDGVWGVDEAPPVEVRERITYRHHTRRANLLSKQPAERVGLFPVGTAAKMRAEFELNHKGDEVLSVEEKTVVVI